MIKLQIKILDNKRGKNLVNLNKIIEKLFYFFIFVSIPVFTQNSLTYQEYCKQSKLESLNPIKVGKPGVQPFWNEKSIMFKYAPVFNNNNSSWIISKAKYYKYTAFSFTDKKHYSFTANSPYESLAPIWNELPLGEVYLKVEAISDDENVFNLAGSRHFYKTATFCPPYPNAKYSYKEALLKGLQFIYNQQHIKNWYFTGKPDHKNHKLYCYSALEVGSVVNAMLLYNEYFPMNDTALVIARNAADYLIKNSEAETNPLKYFPQVYEGKELTADKFQDEIIMTEPASTGMTYLALYKRANDKKYLDAALRIANTYLDTQLNNGTWFIRINKHTGKPTSNEFCIPLKITNFLFTLVEDFNYNVYKSSAEKAIKWVWQNPMKTYNWTGQFEDVEAQRPYTNLTKYEASWFAQYLLKNLEQDSSYLPLAKELIAFCEDQFVVWDKPMIYDSWGNSSDNWHTPAVLEQYSCYVPIDASAVQMIETFYLAYQKTNNKIYLEKAIALLNSLINSQKENGMIPTFWAKGFDEFWNNCMVSDLYVLETFSNL